MAYELIDPSAKLTFANDWTAYLAGVPGGGVTISTRQWSISPATGITLTGATTANCRVEGMTEGKIYVLTERVILSNGDEDQRSITIRAEATQ